MTWLLTWVVVLGLFTSCAGAQHDVAMAAAAQPGYEFGDAPAVEEAPPPPPPEEAQLDYGYELSSRHKSRGGGASGFGSELASPAAGPKGETTGAEPPGDLAATGQPAGAIAPVRQHPLLIYRAQLVLAVFETKVTLDRIEQMARDIGGYLVQRDNETIVVRVPAPRFEQAMKDAAALGDELSRQVTAEDVSEQYRDLRIRLDNAEAVRERLEALLAKAEKVEEALLVEEQLTRITTAIEQMKGKLKVLDELIAFSTITVTLSPHVTKEHLTKRVTLPFPWLHGLGLSNLLNLEAQ